jgi:hypothetical protein
VVARVDPTPDGAEFRAAHPGRWHLVIPGPSVRVAPNWRVGAARARKGSGALVQRGRPLVRGVADAVMRGGAGDDGRGDARSRRRGSETAAAVKTPVEAAASCAAASARATSHCRSWRWIVFAHAASRKPARRPLALARRAWPPGPASAMADEAAVLLLADAERKGARSRT